MLACGGCSGAGSSGVVRIQGAGATFPNPLYQKWFSEYNKLHSDRKFDYQSIGSGGGIKQVTAGTVDFGGSDAPMRDDELKAAPGEILHIPSVLGADVIAYNLPGVEGELKLTPETIAGVFLGTIRKWNDPHLVAVNPGVNLPDANITVVHRSEGSGTTFVFTEYLSKVNAEWKAKVGAGVSVNWPVGLGAKGNEGVTGQVKQTPNSIGYVELIYAEETGMPHAAVKNSAGEFVKATLESISAAAAGVADTMPDDLRVSVTNAPGKDAYPISAFTYLLVYKDQSDEKKGRAIAEFLRWAITDGQQLAREMRYAPLPEAVVAKAERRIAEMKFQGRPLVSG